MAVFGLKVKGQWMWWKEVRRYIAQQEAEYDVLKNASEEEISKLKQANKEEIEKFQAGLSKAEADVEYLRSLNERMEKEAVEADKKLAEQDVVTRNLADENSALREKIRDLRARINTLSGQNAKMKKQLDALPQRGEGGRFVKKQAEVPKLDVEVQSANKE